MFICSCVVEWNGNGYACPLSEVSCEMRFFLPFLPNAPPSLPPSLTHFSSFLCPCISLPSFSPSLSDHALYRRFFPSFFARSSTLPIRPHLALQNYFSSPATFSLSGFQPFSPFPLDSAILYSPCSISTFSCINYPASLSQQICMFPFDRLPIDCILAIAFPIQLHSPFHSFFSLSHHYSFLFP